MDKMNKIEGDKEIYEDITISYNLKKNEEKNKIKRDKEIYEKVQTLNYTEKREYLKTLTDEEKERYRRYAKKITNAKYNTGEAREINNEKKRVDIAKKRAEDPEHYKQINREHNEYYRARTNL